MIYLDANVLVYAASNSGALGNKARQAMTDALAEGACTSALTIDELLWALQKKKISKTVASAAARAAMNTVEIVDVERRDVDAAIALFENGMDPRDAIHASVALRRGCSRIISSDRAFSSIPKLKHQIL